QTDNANFRLNLALPAPFPQDAEQAATLNNTFYRPLSAVYPPLLDAAKVGQKQPLGIGTFVAGVAEYRRHSEIVDLTNVDPRLGHFNFAYRTTAPGFVRFPRRSADRSNYWPGLGELEDPALRGLGFPVADLRRAGVECKNDDVLHVRFEK